MNAIKTLKEHGLTAWSYQDKLLVYEHYLDAKRQNVMRIVKVDVKDIKNYLGY